MSFDEEMCLLRELNPGRALCQHGEPLLHQSQVAGVEILSPILSGEFSLADAINAFELASDRSRAMKVSLVA